MTENISYKRCVCDICKKEENTSQTLILPVGWCRINVDRSYDACPNCISEIKSKIKEMEQRLI